MSHFLTVPVNENRIIIDPKIDDEIKIAAVPPFKFTEVFLYSHGWWNTASNAASEYNIFSIGFSKALHNLLATVPAELPRFTANFSGLALAMHWPSMMSEDQKSVENFLQATSFFTMEHRADSVGKNSGYSLLRLLIEARLGQPPLRFHMIGHSFGCRVVCSALQALAGDSGTIAAARAINAEFNVALLQAAADADSLAAGGLYENVLTAIPNLRMLVTTSQLDTALGKWYPVAQDLAHLFKGATPALGAVGPQGNLPVAVSDKFSVLASPVHQPFGPLGVADLTPLHVADAGKWGKNGWGGQHSDINLPEIYEMLSK